MGTDRTPSPTVLKPKISGGFKAFFSSIPRPAIINNTLHYWGYTGIINGLFEVDSWHMKCELHTCTLFMGILLVQIGETTCPIFFSVKNESGASRRGEMDFGSDG